VHLNIPTILTVLPTTASVSTIAAIDPHSGIFLI
jgi:hypothetical protein